MSRAGVAEAGFTLLELLVVLTVMALVTVVVGPRFSSWREPGLRQVGRDLALELRSARGASMRTGGIGRLDAAGLEARLPPGFSLSGASIVFYPDGRTSGGSMVLAAASGTMRLDVDWLTGAVAVSR